MPNWCENRLAISGDVADVKTFIKKGLDENGNWNLDNYYPMPKELHDNGWYYWRIANWGTKWDVDAQDVNEDDDVIYFLSAWSPPCEWLDKVATDNPHLSFRLTYVEGGIFFAGISEFVKGRHTLSDVCEPMYVNEDGDELNASEIDWDNDYAMVVCPYDYE
jgi:hypothetical protein